MLDVVSCGEPAQRPLYFTAFHSKKGSHAEKYVHHLADKRTDPHLIPAQAGGEAVMDTCQGKSCRVTSFVSIPASVHLFFCSYRSS